MINVRKNHGHVILLVLRMLEHKGSNKLFGSFGDLLFKMIVAKNTCKAAKTDKTYLTKQTD